MTNTAFSLIAGNIDTERLKVDLPHLSELLWIKTLEAFIDRRTKALNQYVLGHDCSHSIKNNVIKKINLHKHS